MNRLTFSLVVGHGTKKRWNGFYRWVEHTGKFSWLWKLMFSSSEQMYLEKKKLKVLTELLEGGTIPLGIFQCFQMVHRRSRINQLKNLSSSLLAPLFGRWPILKYSFSGPRPALIELFQLGNQVLKLLHSPSHNDLHNIHKLCFQEISFHLCSLGTDECYDGKWVTLLSLCLWVFSIKRQSNGVYTK